MKDSIPKHIAIIMDGNSRWAIKNNVNLSVAYEKGINTANKIVSYAKSLNVKYLTLYAFSIENWNRSSKKTSVLAYLLKNYLHQKLNKLIYQGISIDFIGDLSMIEENIKKLMRKISNKSQHNSFKLQIAISYSSKNEIIRSIASLRRKYSLLNNIDNLKIEKLFNQIINPKNLPDPDLLIRTSGEQRLSNFMLWQLSYTELYFCDKLWPDFTEKDLLKAIQEYKTRSRRYGK